MAVELRLSRPAAKCRPGKSSTAIMFGCATTRPQVSCVISRNAVPNRDGHFVGSSAYTEVSQSLTGPTSGCRDIS